MEGNTWDYRFLVDFGMLCLSYNRIKQFCDQQ